MGSRAGEGRVVANGPIRTSMVVIHVDGGHSVWAWTDEALAWDDLVGQMAIATRDKPCSRAIVTTGLMSITYDAAEVVMFVLDLGTHGRRMLDVGDAQRANARATAFPAQLRCRTWAHPGTSRAGFQCVLSDGHDGRGEPHDFGPEHREHLRQHGKGPKP